MEINVLALEFIIGQFVALFLAEFHVFMTVQFDSISDFTID